MRWSRIVVVRRVVGGSMLPGLRPGRLVLGLYPRRLSVGDVIIFNHLGRERIKRVAVIQGGDLFVVGDNPSASTDSRDFGSIDRRDVRARVIWPLVRARK